MPRWRPKASGPPTHQYSKHMKCFVPTGADTLGVVWQTALRRLAEGEAARLAGNGAWELAG